MTQFNVNISVGVRHWGVSDTETRLIWWVSVLHTFTTVWINSNNRNPYVNAGRKGQGDPNYIVCIWNKHISSKLVWNAIADCSCWFIHLHNTYYVSCSSQQIQFIYRSLWGQCFFFCYCSLISLFILLLILFIWLILSEVYSDN
jgi:hypothetical protein